MLMIANIPFFIILYFTAKNLFYFRKLVPFDNFYTILATHHQHSGSHKSDHFFFNSIYKWDNTVFAWLTSSIMPPSSIHAVANGWISYFLWLNGIHGCVCAHTDYFFFIHLSNDGCLHCFHALAIANSAMIKMVDADIFEILTSFSSDI